MTSPDRGWFTDITQHRAADGWVYGCAVVDFYSAGWFGWSIADHIRSELVLEAPGGFLCGIGMRCTAGAAHTKVRCLDAEPSPFPDWSS